MKRLFSLLLILSLLLCGCSQSVSATHYAMNTVMSFELWGREAETGRSQIVSALSDLEKTWSATDADSLLSQLNAGTALLTEEQADLLARVEALSQRTGGAFDPKMGLVSQAWGFYNEEHRVPTQAQIEAALADPQWDLGGALKGCAGQECVSILSGLKIDQAILNLGGNVQTYGQKADGTAWKVGIQDPDGGNYLGILSVSGTMAVVTSGDYQRYFEEDGVRYHHILDPETGRPADSGLRSVTVVCADGLTADCLSTALFVMGLEEGSRFWRESDDFEAVFIAEDGAIYATEGASLSGCQYEVISR